MGAMKIGVVGIALFALLPVMLVLALIFSAFEAGVGVGIIASIPLGGLLLVIIWMLSALWEMAVDRNVR